MTGGLAPQITNGCIETKCIERLIMPDIKERARQKASEKAVKQSSQSEVSNKELTTYEDLVSNYKTLEVPTTSGNLFKIQSISPGAYFLMTGAPLLDVLTEKGLSEGSIEDRQRAFDELPDDEKMSIISSDDYLEYVQRACCAGIISINFVMKRHDKCSNIKKEVSIDLLNAKDLFEIFGEIMKVSVSESEGELMETFRDEDETEQERHDTDSPTLESIS